MKLFIHLLMIFAFFALVYGQNYPVSKFTSLKTYITQASNSAKTFATFSNASPVTANVVSNVKTSLNEISNNFYDAVSIIDAKDGSLSTEQASQLKTLFDSIDTSVNTGVTNLINNKSAYQSANGLQIIAKQLALLDSAVSAYATAVIEILPETSQGSAKTTGGHISTIAHNGCASFDSSSC